jgi:5-methylcytosine-specific restriction enzyme subunit McrC
MKNRLPITRFEHKKLFVGEEGFTKSHFDTLLRYNEQNGFKYFDPIANGIKFKQFVGVLQVGNLTIEILPKIDEGASVEDGKWRNALITMLKECRKIEINTFEEALLKASKHNLIDIYFELYLKELDKLMRQGLIKKYRKEASNVSAFKGKLLFAQHIKANITHEERFYTEHQVYDRNHKLHQILNKALSVVAKFSEGKNLFSLCKRIQLNFPEVDDINPSKQLLDTFFKPNRKNTSYARAYEIARIILLNYAPDVSAGREKMFSILFDMNKLWEEFVYVRLKKALQNGPYQASAQQQKSFWENNQLRPDIVLTEIETGTPVGIIDTKWKIPNTSPSSSDLQQVYAYSKYWNVERVMLLYPSITKYRDVGFKKFKPIGNEAQGSCKIAIVTIFEGKNDIKQTIGNEVKELILG